MSRAEAKEVQRRIHVTELIAPGVDAAIKDPTWAGWWVDNSAAGQPVFMAAGDPASIRAAVREAVPPEVSFRVESVAFSFEQLEVQQGHLVEAIDSLAREGVRITSVGIDVPGNQLAVGVTSATPTSIKSITALVDVPAAIYDEDLGSLDACPENNCLNPIRGGVGITNQGEAPNHTPCTAGYLARRTDVSPDQLVFVTAGHCVVALAESVGGGPWRHGSQNVGANAQQSGDPVHTFEDESNADVGVVKTDLVPASWKTSRSYVLVNNSAYYLPVTQVVHHNDQSAGQFVCRMGRRTGLQCGFIDNVNVTRVSELGSRDYDIRHSVDYEADALGGDSGGPIFQSVEFGSSPYARLFGTHFHSGGPDDQDELEERFDGWYPPVTRGVNTLGSTLGVDIIPCTTYSCGLP
jgi:hypothetical protein